MSFWKISCAFSTGSKGFEISRVVAQDVVVFMCTIQMKFHNHSSSSWINKHVKTLTEMVCLQSALRLSMVTSTVARGRGEKLKHHTTSATASFRPTTDPLVSHFSLWSCRELKWHRSTSFYNRLRGKLLIGWYRKLGYPHRPDRRPPSWYHPLYGRYANS